MPAVRFGWTEGQKQIRLDSQKFAIVSAKDRMLPPGQWKRWAAKKMGAVTTTLSSCHMVILEENQPRFAKVIDEAAKKCDGDEAIRKLKKKASTARQRQ